MTTTRPPEGRTQPVTRIEVGETAEAFVEALVAQGVDCLFLNPGTDTFPVQEAIRKLEEQGRDAPRVVLCLFEIVALAAAHGYYAATGRPQAVLVHVDVGTQNLGSMLHNAQRGRAAVVIAAGRAPYTSDPMERGAAAATSTGSRSSWISTASSATTPSGTTSFDGLTRSARRSTGHFRLRPAIRRAPST
ncbi:MAG: thiamine pyrophosphate-binding protein [Thermomicrobiales bacterium]